MIDLEKKPHIFFELAVVLGIFGLFASISILTAGSRNVSSGWGIILLALFCDLAAVAYCFVHSVKHKANLRQKYFDFAANNFLILIFCAVFIVLAGFQFTNIPRGDGSLYYGHLMYATERYANTVSSFMRGYILQHHISYGVCLFLAMGEMLFPRQVVGVYGVSLIITVISFLCFYGILSHLFKKTSNNTKAIGTAVLMFYPYILGLFTYMNPDYFVCIFTVIMVYCYLRKFNILFYFFGIVLVLTKEPGVVIYCAFIGANTLANFFIYKEAGIIERLKKSVLSPGFLINIVLPVLFLVFFLISRKVSSNNTFVISEEISLTASTDARDIFTSISWDNNGMWCFGFKPRYILEWLTVFFVSNSTWLTVIVCVSGLAVYIFRHIKRRQIKVLSPENVPVFIGITGILAAYTAFTSLYLLPYCPRYVTVGGFCLAVFAFASVHVLFRKKVARNVVLGLLAGLFFVQTYINIDPYMHLRCFYFYAGKRFLYGAVYKDVPTGWAGDSRNFNYEHTYCESLLKSILRQIDPNDDTIIIQVMARHAEINLCGAETSVYWNTRTKKRTYDYNDPDSIYLKVTELREPEEVKKYAYPDTFYLLTVPNYDYYNPRFLKEFEEHNYSVSDVYKAENTVGWMTVYKMTKTSGS